MLRTILLIALLFAARLCSAQILIEPNPQALSYLMYAGQPPRAVISTMSDAEKSKLQQVYSTVLRNSASLDAEGDALSAQANDYRKVLIAAMVKADPEIQSMLGTSGGPTPDQATRILQAQAQAMQADPKLQKEWDDLTKKMKAHQEAIDAAMVKVDPNVKQILEKLSP